MVRKLKVHMMAFAGQRSVCGHMGWPDPHRLTVDWKKVTCGHCLARVRPRRMKPPFSTEELKNSSPERFRIVWTGTAYRVSIPNYNGGEVVPAEAYDRVLTELQATQRALAHHEIREPSGIKRV